MTKFNGGDNLKGFEKRVNEVFMLTELINNGFGAYKLSYGENNIGGNSGLTFGGNQMDLSQDMEGKKRELFLNILKNSVDSQGNKIISDDEYKKIADNKKISLKGNRPETVFGGLIHKVNSALSSEYGKKKINEVYLTELRSKIAHVTKIIKSLNEINRDIILGNEELMIRLIDFHNQFDMSYKGKMHLFLDGQTVEIKNYKYFKDTNTNKYNKFKDPLFNDAYLAKYIHTLKLEGVPTVEEIIRFIRLLEQYNKTPEAGRAVEMRLSKLDMYFGKQYIPKDPNVFDFHNKDFNIIVGDKYAKCISKGNVLTIQSLKINIDKNKLEKFIMNFPATNNLKLVVNGRTIHESSPDFLNSNCNEVSNISKQLYPGYVFEEVNGVLICTDLQHNMSFRVSDYLFLMRGTNLMKIGNKWIFKNMEGNFQEIFINDKNPEAPCIAQWVNDFDLKPYLIDGNNTIDAFLIIKENESSYIKIDANNKELNWWYVNLGSFFY